MDYKHAPLPVLNGPRITLRPLDPAEFGQAAQRLAQDPNAARWWSNDATTIERWIADPDYQRFVIEAAGTEIGILLFEEELDPDYTFASFDISLYESAVGSGLGPEALRVCARWLVATHGHHRFLIDPACENTFAIRAYEKAGFKPVGVLRSCERIGDGEWRDALLMDLLAGEIPPEPVE